MFSFISINNIIVSAWKRAYNRAHCYSAIITAAMITTKTVMALRIVMTMIVELGNKG